MRSGNINLTVGAGSFRLAVLNGRYRTSTSGNDFTTYRFNFNMSGVYPSNGPYTYHDGFPLRCLSTTAVGNDIKIDWTTSAANSSNDLSICGTNKNEKCKNYEPTTTETQVPKQEESPSQTATRSWDFGDWVLATPTRGTAQKRRSVAATGPPLAAP